MKQIKFKLLFRSLRSSCFIVSGIILLFAVPVVLWITSLPALAAEEPKPAITVFSNQAVKLTVGRYAHFNWIPDSISALVSTKDPFFYWRSSLPLCTSLLNEEFVFEV